MKLSHLLFSFFSIIFCNAENITWQNFQQIVTNATLKQFNFSNSEVKQAFEKFKLDYNRVYETKEEEEQRFSAFIDNFKFVKTVNYLYTRGKSSYDAIINQFSDMTKKELEENKQFLRSVKPHEIEQSRMSSNFSFHFTLPKQLDWRNYNYVTPVKDQGDCGSCYAFAAIGCLESQVFRKTGILQSLSVQQVLDCGMGMGCNGSLPIRVYEYIRKNGGINTNADYPYVSFGGGEVNQTCKFNKNKTNVKVFGYVNIKPRGDENMLKYAVATVGPICVDIDANHKEFLYYRKGVLEIPNCKKKQKLLNHSGVLIGYGIENDIPYWLIKNSFGKYWGLNGFYKLRRNANNMCGVATFASYPVV